MVRAGVRSTRRGDMVLNEVDKREDTIVVEEDGGLFGSLGSKYLFLFCGAKRHMVEQAGPIAKWARLWKDEVDAGRQADIPEDMSDPEGAGRVHIFSSVQYYRKELVVEQVYHKLVSLREVIEAELASRYGKRDDVESE
ncbi:hypothetical protein FAGAP_12517 [Fusarium agapanthi]|uniref:Uncharacterized protein n=1 Tax=Fusarium agapanthi TaxID=1803897 RepID=A0A9P5E8S1_9HYPO|nr:hypothetical protein FAGAP_12517 [Fusarium agapanthi]